MMSRVLSFERFMTSETSIVHSAGCISGYMDVSEAGPVVSCQCHVWACRGIRQVVEGRACRQCEALHRSVRPLREVYMYVPSRRCTCTVQRAAVLLITVVKMSMYTHMTTET